MFPYIIGSIIGGYILVTKFPKEYKIFNIFSTPLFIIGLFFPILELKHNLLQGGSIALGLTRMIGLNDNLTQILLIYIFGVLFSILAISLSIKFNKKTIQSFFTLLLIFICFVVFSALFSEFDSFINIVVKGNLSGNSVLISQLVSAFKGLLLNYVGIGFYTLIVLPIVIASSSITYILNSNNSNKNNSKGNNHQENIIINKVNTETNNQNFEDDFESDTDFEEDNTKTIFDEINKKKNNINFIQLIKTKFLDFYNLFKEKKLIIPLIIIIILLIKLKLFNSINIDGNRELSQIIDDNLAFTYTDKIHFILKISVLIQIGIIVYSYIKSKIYEKNLYFIGISYFSIITILILILTLGELYFMYIIPDLLVGIYLFNYLEKNNYLETIYNKTNNFIIFKSIYKIGNQIYNKLNSSLKGDNKHKLEKYKNIISKHNIISVSLVLLLVLFTIFKSLVVYNLKVQEEKTKFDDRTNCRFIDGPVTDEIREYCGGFLKEGI